MRSDWNPEQYLLTQMVHFSAKPIFLCSQWETCSASSLDRMGSEWNLYSKPTCAWSHLRAFEWVLKGMLRVSRSRALSSPRWRKGGEGLRTADCVQVKRRAALMKAVDFDIQRLYFHFNFTERMLVTRDHDAFRKWGRTLLQKKFCTPGKYPRYTVKWEKQVELHGCMS